MLGGLETALGGRLQFKAERLPTEDVEGPVAHCFNHRIGRSEISVEDHRRIGELLPDSFEHLNAVDWSHAQLGEQQVALAFNEDFDGGSGIRGGHDLETGGLQVALGPLQKILIGIDDDGELCDGTGMGCGHWCVVVAGMGKKRSQRPPNRRCRRE